nr:hypothetical protein [Streptomyces sp. YIM 130001]
MAEAPAFRRVGATADGAMKVLLGVVFAACASWVGDLIGVSSLLMWSSAAALLVGGVVELACVRSRSQRHFTRLMIAYDSGWALAAAAGLLTAWLGGTAGGELWTGYQVVAPLVFAGLLLASGPMRTAPAPRPDAPRSAV